MNIMNDKAYGCAEGQGALTGRPRTQIHVGGLYQHFLRKEVFKVTAIARHDDLGVDMVVHVGLHDGRTWVRAAENFAGMKNGANRFTFVGFSTTTTTN